MFCCAHRGGADEPEPARVPNTRVELHRQRVVGQLVEIRAAVGVVGGGPAADLLRRPEHQPDGAARHEPAGLDRLQRLPGREGLP